MFSPSAANQRSRRPSGKAAGVITTHPIPRRSYWSGIQGKRSSLISKSKDAIFTNTTTNTAHNSHADSSSPWRFWRNHDSKSLSVRRPSKISADHENLRLLIGFGREYLKRKRTHLKNFETMDLFAPLQRALAEQNYQQPTPIQLE